MILNIEHYSSSQTDSLLLRVLANQHSIGTISKTKKTVLLTALPIFHLHFGKSITFEDDFAMQLYIHKNTPQSLLLMKPTQKLLHKIFSSAVLSGLAEMSSLR